MGAELHSQVDSVHSELLHPTGFGPSPSPQQKRFFGDPPVWPRQSAAHERQSSPPPASQTPFPHTGPVDGQSIEQVSQTSPRVHSPSPHKEQSGSLQASQPDGQQPSVEPHDGSVPLRQPSDASQVSTPLQSFPSLHVSGAPGWQPLAPLQVSAPLQTLASLQSALLAHGWSHTSPRPSPSASA
jgi:hypothetical protein